MKKKISWITPDYYIDVDLPIVDRLSQIFTIKWMIVISRNASIIDNKKFVEHRLTHKSNLLISFTKLECRSVSPKIWKSYYRIVEEAKTFNPDIYYISLYGMPHALLFYKFFYRKINV